MMGGSRSILSLTPLVDPDADRPMQLGVYDVLLPCRQFLIDHKVAVLGSVSLTAEFVLRLVRSIEGISEEDTASFFGFDRRDMSFVLNEAEVHGYVVRQDGRLWLTKAGESLFRAGSRYPEIFEVEQRREKTGFDLIALAPQEFTPLDEFQRRLPEFKLADAGVVSSATSHVPQAFRRHYSEFARRKDISAKRSLYSIDDVSAADRFSSTVRISVLSTGLRPSLAEPDLSDWRPDYERDDRSAVVQAAVRFVDELSVPRRPGDPEAYAILVELAPEFLREFIRRDGLAVERYYREAFIRVGEVRSDRPTVPLLGSIFTRESTRRFFEIADYGVRASPMRPALALWATPQIPHWGATSLLPEVLAHMKSNILSEDEDDGQEPATIALVSDLPSRYVDAAFDMVAVGETMRPLPPALEMVLIPGIAIAAVVNAPIGTSNGTPVPLGFASFDSHVLRRAQSYFGNLVESYSLPHELSRTVRSALVTGDAE